MDRFDNKKLKVGGVMDEKYINYLNDLRESGETNMFGAAIYVEQTFGVSKDESRKIVKHWMKNFKNKNELKT